MSGATGVRGSRRVRARVVIDLRLVACIQALAVDPRGQLCAWSRRPLPEGCLLGDRVRHARQAVQDLGVAVDELRVLWGPHDIELAIDTDDMPLDRNQAEAVIRRDAMVGLDESVACVFRATPAGSLIFGGNEAPMLAVAEAFDDVLPGGPAHSVDLLLLWDLCGEGNALVDGSEGLLTLVAREPRRPLLRRIPLHDVEATQAADLEKLVARGLPVRCSGLPVPLSDAARKALPRLENQSLPASFELAWQLGRAESFPRLQGPGIDRRRSSYRAARALAHIGLLVLLVGSVLGYYGYTARARALAVRDQAVRSGAPLLERLEILRRSERLDQENEAREEVLVALDPPQPPLGVLLYELARELPERVGWSQLTVSEGRLELLLVATDREELEEYRETFQSRPELTDVGWQPMVFNVRAGMWSQTVHGILAVGF